MYYSLFCHYLFLFYRMLVRRVLKKVIGKWKVDDLEFKEVSDDMFTGLQQMLIGIVFERTAQLNS